MKVVSKPVKMLAVFGYKDEPPIPYKFKLMEDSGEEVTIKVDYCYGVYRKKVIGIDCVVYECQSRIGNRERRYQLKYLVLTCKWMLYKI